MKIAFLFLIRENLNHPRLWETFFNNGSDFSIHIHYVNNVDIGWFDQFKVKNPVPTKWGSISLVSAMNLLLETALQDPLNEMFIFVSESCVPVKTIDHIKNNIDVNFSYFNYFTNIFPKNNHVTQFFDRENIKAASQWSILNRKHAEYIMTIRGEMIERFAPTFAPDEACYPTYLYTMFGGDEIKNLMTTCVIWNNKNKYFKKNLEQGLTKTTPYEFILFDRNELNYVVRTEYMFFLRKIRKGCLISYDGYDAFPQNIGKIQMFRIASEPKHLESALKICKDNQYGGFIVLHNKFYYRKRSVKELTDSNNLIKTKKSMLVVCQTVEDVLIDMITQPLHHTTTSNHFEACDLH